MQSHWFQDWCFTAVYGDGCRAGRGSIESSDGLINCGADCTETYDMGSQLELTVTASAGMVFEGWEGSPDCGGRIAVSGNMNCTAHFVADTEDDALIFSNGFEN